MIRDYSGDKLRSLRKRARLSQQQVAKLSKVSEAAIWYLEQGKRKPHTRTLERLLNLYAIRIQYWNNLEQSLKEKENG
jgi:transcriptional regulator with XRE-family HTH domain